MHELSIATAVMDTARAEAERAGGGRITAVGLCIGPLAGIDEESLRFCFDALARDTEFAHTSLVIEAGPGAELDFKYLELEQDDGTDLCRAQSTQ